MREFPVGTGLESYPSYQPNNISSIETERATLFGELRVSKSLIDGVFGADCLTHETNVFRSGGLSFHPNLAETMERMGYAFDSSRAVGDVLSNFPFQLTTEWDAQRVSRDTSVFEFPLTIDDVKPPRIDQRVADALGVISANADNGAPTTVLIHPDNADFKLNAQRAILQGLPSGVRAMGLVPFAEFWRARDRIEITGITHDAGAKTLTVTLAVGDAVTGLTLRVPSSVVSVSQPPGTQLLTQGTAGKLLVLPALTKGQQLTVVMGM
jgi:hypothetical protein